MNKLSPGLLCQIYLLLVLMAATITSAPPYSLLALALLLIVIFITFRTIPPSLNIAVAAVAVFLVPLVLEPPLSYMTLFTPATAQITAAVATLPVIYLLDYSLRQNARLIRASARRRTPGRYTTDISRSLLVSTLVMLLISPILDKPVLLFAGIISALYLLVTLIRVSLTIPRLPIDMPIIWKRVIAGTTVDIPIDIMSKASVMTHTLISPVDPWVKVTPRRFILNRGKTRINLSITPPLAGPSHPQLQVSVMDIRGFAQVNQLIEPVDLHVIPRARYAEWLAKKYLKQPGAGMTSSAMLPPEAMAILKRGTEYHDSRSYQPGDPLKDIDWKHTQKLRQLIIKEYVEAGEQAAIIAVNLAVTDTEEADKLAFNLITAALTLAQEGIPAALAAYDHRRVVLTTTVSDPSIILKRTLSLVKEITTVEFTSRCLELPDIGKLRRNIAWLKQAKSEPAQRLLGMLDFEYRAIEEAAKKHPATIALSLVTEQAPVPSMIVLVSQLNHDAEALLVTTEKLSGRNFTIIPVEATE